MSENIQPNSFYSGVPVFRDFVNVTEPSLYQPLPGDWMVGVADIEQSTKAIRENRYKAVNMAGAAVIVAVTNALNGRDFPFVFGGDGASFAVSASDAGLAREALATTATWVRQELDLTLRVAMIPISAVRSHGADVRVARFAASDNISIAMFSGGGMAWAEAAMKNDQFSVPLSLPNVRPDLTGLSCRYEEIPASRGVIMSLVVVQAPGGSPDAFRTVVEDVVRLVNETPGASRPVTSRSLQVKWPPQGYALEARAQRRSGEWLIARQTKVLVWTLFYYLVMRFGIRMGSFVPQKYNQQVVENSDFRKYDDALRMVLDCTSVLAAEIEHRLAAAAEKGTIRFGLHRQDAAMITCFTPSPTSANHVHFIDGARGGYAIAASALKASAT